MYFHSCSGAAPALRRLHAHFYLGGAVEEKSNRWDWSALVAFFGYWKVVDSRLRIGSSLFR